MKKSIKVVSASFIICHLSFSPASAQNRAALYDSTQVEALQEVVVKGVRAQKNAPYAISNILHGDSTNVIEDITAYCDSECIETRENCRVGFC